MTTDAPDRLREAGLRVTSPRVAVLDAVATHPHADTRAITAEVRAGLASVSHQTVYDCLDVLTGAGLLRRIQPMGSTARYELRVGDNHHHLVCRTCGDVVDVDCAVGDVPCLEAATDHGYSITEAEVIYWGLCPRCQSNPPPHRPSTR